MNITVLIANHNYSSYIEKSILSALNQTVKPTCICIVDDGSTDNSWEIISKFAEQNQTLEENKDSPQGNINIKVGKIEETDIVAIRLPMAFGPSHARNVGIASTLVATDFYAILDADDEMLQNKLEECIKPFKDESIGVVYANYYNINSQTGIKILEIKPPYDQLKLQRECIIHSGSLIRAKYLELAKDEFGFYDQTMRTCEDFELWIRLSRICLFYHIPLALTNVLVHPQNSTNSVRKEIWERNWQRIIEKHFK